MSSDDLQQSNFITHVCRLFNLFNLLIDRKFGIVTKQDTLAFVLVHLSCIVNCNHQGIYTLKIEWRRSNVSIFWLLLFHFEKFFIRKSCLHFMLTLLIILVLNLDRDDVYYMYKNKIWQDIRISYPMKYIPLANKVDGGNTINLFK